MLFKIQQGPPPYIFGNLVDLVIFKVPVELNFWFNLPKYVGEIIHKDMQIYYFLIQHL